jgi:hypothetical protein
MKRISRFASGLLVAAAALILGNVVSAQDNSATEPAEGKLTQSSDRHENSGAQNGNSPDTSKGTPTASPARPSHDQDGNASSDRKTHIRLGTVIIGAGYGRFSSLPYYPYGPYSFYPYDAVYPGVLWSPIWGSYYGPEYLSYGNGKGEVRLAAEPKDAAVYLDGAYAGTANRLKSIWLDPGAYDLSVSAKGRDSFQERIYVLSGKVLKLTAKLTSQAKP